MERKILILDNQKECPVVAEDALDFNFDDEEKNSPAPGGVPFMHKLGNPFRLKDVLVIEGTILKYGLRFTVNLLYGFNEIAFHLNPRMDQNYIARNSFLNGEWGQEEGFGLMKSPLHSGKNFQIMIFISQEAYLVCVNGFHMFSFAHRVPPQNVEKIEIFGDIDLKAASLMSSNIYPDPNLIKFKKSFETLHLPFTYKLEEDLKPGFKIEIKGKIKLLPVSFRINLQSGAQFFPHPLITYHLNVRYAPECYVVQNSWGSGGANWDEEVRSPLPLSLSPGKDFEINIYIHDSYILVKGENWSLPPFKLRINLSDVSCIYIQGDIIMTFFKITSFNRPEDWNDYISDNV
ncbi:galectin-8 isoform X2 [Halyomorpha halys]|uniref:galectin-8 isoform X2 n=1 Tax=Halyomorpha halys TaxID=286706 RepID=UPI0006D5025A|nr:galectin-8-like isoform X2 [Halyomorpha halys]XP_024215353.1 galectin-8-like isoform X2 [Halyomorpha halys]XP_024215356.1 galectin-8-like isoform X2 [Halyomorpha halys]